MPKIPWKNAVARRAKARGTGFGLSLTACAALSFGSRAALACGGLFCGATQPVDQSAEHILFEVGLDSVTMTTQITYAGDAADFAWVLPLGAVPDTNSLSVFPQAALNALDSATTPNFIVPDPDRCAPLPSNLGSNAITASSNASAAPAATGSVVTVYVQTEVGPYDVAVVGSDDPSQLVTWLRTAGYRITPAMDPYVAAYTAEGMSFLALKLRQSQGVQDIQPFRFTLPGRTPTIPLRMTALAAEPEMSLLVFVLGDQRYEAKNWANLEIQNDQIRYDPFRSFRPKTNWDVLVARVVDQAGGQGWVTEYAGSANPAVSAAMNQQAVNQQAVNQQQASSAGGAAALEGHPYLTRLHTRLSAEEMTSDPVFGKSAGADVPQARYLHREVDGVDQCPSNHQTPNDACDFVTCGAAGTCRSVKNGPGEPLSAGCACLPGATARVTKAPDGSATVICQDGRLSFVNPGDQVGGDTLPDPCATFSCGAHGQCVAMNMTPTCVCDQGYVAVNSNAPAGSPGLQCRAPGAWVPISFYAESLPARPDDLPGGRSVVAGDPSFPFPRYNAAAAAASGGCALRVASPAAHASYWTALLPALALTVERRRARRRS